jgi:hypothetical protein
MFQAVRNLNEAILPTDVQPIPGSGPALYDYLTLRVVENDKRRNSKFVSLEERIAEFYRCQNEAMVAKR